MCFWSHVLRILCQAWGPECFLLKVVIVLHFTFNPRTHVDFCQVQGFGWGSSAYGCPMAPAPRAEDRVSSTSSLCSCHTFAVTSDVPFSSTISVPAFHQSCSFTVSLGMVKGPPGFSLLVQTCWSCSSSFAFPDVFYFFCYSS